MKITSIRGYHVECTLPRTLRNSITQFVSRSSLVVQLVTDSGLSGWGETQSPAASWAIIETTLAPLVLGQDAGNGSAIWRATLEHGAGAAPMRAVSAIDMALWDVRSRALDCSVAALLGGRLRERVAAYASGPFMLPGENPYREFQLEADAFRRAGFTALKGRSGLTPRHDAEMAMTLRRQLGPDFGLMFDINRGYALPSALQALRHLEPAGLLWLEEPIAANDLSGYRQLAAHAGMALAAGEALWSLQECRDLLATGAISIVQPDLFQCGGFSGAQRIAALAEAFGVAYVPHVWGTAINFHASLQLAATLPAQRVAEGVALPMFEYEQCDNALIDICGTPKLNPDGTLSIPDSPGIGIEITPENLAPYVRKSWQLTSP